MKKTVTFGNESRKQLLNGINKVANAVKVTLGAKGRNVIIKKDNGFPPHITKDGVTVARSIELKDDIENMGASLMKEIAHKTAELAGDGTTTSLVLAQELINKGLELIDWESGIKHNESPIIIKNGMERALKDVIAKVKEKAISIKDINDLINIATISANGDAELGKLIAETMDKIGKDGVVTIEDTTKKESYSTVISGLPVESGYVSPYFITNPEKMKCELENPIILIYTKKITDMKEMLAVMEHTQREKRPLLLISDELGYAPLATFAGNKQRGLIEGCAVRIPEGFATKGYAVNDIAAYTGATVVSEELGYSLSKLDYSVFGGAEKVIIEKNKTTIIKGRGENIDKYILSINADIENASLSDEKKYHQKRMAKMSNGVAVIYVSGYTDTEIKEKKDRIDDAVCATRSAMEEGIVAGAGTTLGYISSQLKRGEDKGYNLVLDSLSAPKKQILLNAGIEDMPVSDYGYGMNVRTGEKVHLFQKGIIDPAKVVRVCLENAVSIAGIFLTTECVISDEI